MPGVPGGPSELARPQSPSESRFFSSNAVKFTQPVKVPAPNPDRHQSLRPAKPGPSGLAPDPPGALPRLPR